MVCLSSPSSFDLELWALWGSNFHFYRSGYILAWELFTKVLMKYKYLITTVTLRQYIFPLGIIYFPSEIHVEFTSMTNCQSNSDPEGEVREAALCKSVKVHWLKEVCAHLNHSRNISNHFRCLDQEEYLYEFGLVSVEGVVLFESGDRRNVLQQEVT